MALPSSAAFVAIAAAVAGGIATAVLSDGYTPFIVALVALTTITGVGLNVLLGLSGQISFGHVGFYAIGAYTVSVLTLKGVGFPLALLAAGGLAGAVGALLAVPALRVTGPYLAMMTIAFSFIVEHGAIEWRQVTGGQNGLAGIPQPEFVGLAGERAMAVITVAIAGTSLVLFEILARGGWGRSMIAVRDSEVAAAGLGLRPTVVKTLSFALSALVTGVAGGCFAALLAFVAPSAFPFSQSILFLLAVVVGGAGYTLGPLVGAGLTVVLPELISSLAEYRLLVFGALLLVVLWIAPGGVIGAFASRLRRDPRPDSPAPDFDVAAFLGPAAHGPSLTITGLSIAFGGVSAASNVGMTVAPAKVTGLIGPNGAGKSTVLNMVSGFYKPDAGGIRLGDFELAGLSASEVARAGVARTYQTTHLFPTLSVLDNVALGLRRGRLGSPLAGTATATDLRDAAGLLALVGYGGSPDAAAADLAHVDRRLVEIARALATRPAVLLLDEPAAGLSAPEKQQLGVVLRRIADAGIAVLLVEHDMGLVMSLSDHIVVLDSGRVIASATPAEVRADPAVRAAYLGSGELRVSSRAEAAVSQAPVVSKAPVVLRAKGLTAGYGAIAVLHGISLEVRQGELVALLGSNGAGKSTTMRALAGLLRPVSGEISVDGRDFATAPPHALVAAGLSLVPEGRQVFPQMTVRENLLLGAYSHPAIDADAEIEKLLAIFPRLVPRLDAAAGLLSGGEAQMLAIARGLMSQPHLLLLDEPSLGLAPAIIEDVYEVMSRLRDSGATVLLVDQMASMALATADRAYVLASGRIVRSGAAVELARDPALENAYLGQTSADAS